MRNEQNDGCRIDPLIPVPLYAKFPPGKSCEYMLVVLFGIASSVLLVNSASRSATHDFSRVFRVTQKMVNHSLRSVAYEMIYKEGVLFMHEKSHQPILNRRTGYLAIDGMFVSDPLCRTYQIECGGTAVSHPPFIPLLC
jgi:hypothetical protein